LGGITADHWPPLTQQGGRLPSWHTTVVPLPGGTTTVVFFAGSGGLLLLMQPASTQAARTIADMTFIVFSCYGAQTTATACFRRLLWTCRGVSGRGLGRVNLCGGSYKSRQS
jgi:hypothetical protein